MRIQGRSDGFCCGFILAALALVACERGHAEEHLVRQTASLVAEAPERQLYETVVSATYKKKLGHAAARGGDIELVAWVDEMRLTVAKRGQSGELIAPFATLGPEVEVLTPPTLVFDGERFLLAWSAQGVVYAARVSASGELLDRDGVALASGGLPQLTASPAGVLLSYRQDGGVAASRLHGETLELTDSPAMVVVPPPAAGDILRAFSLPLDDGWLAVWDDKSSGNRDIYARGISASGTLGSVVSLVSDGFDQELVAAAVAGDGLLVAWRHLGSTPVSRVQLFDAVARTPRATRFELDTILPGPILPLDGAFLMVVSESKYLGLMRVSAAGTLTDAEPIALGFRARTDPYPPLTITLHPSSGSSLDLLWTGRDLDDDLLTFHQMYRATFDVEAGAVTAGTARVPLDAREPHALGKLDAAYNGGRRFLIAFEDAPPALDVGHHEAVSLVGRVDEELNMLDAEGLAVQASTGTLTAHSAPSVASAGSAHHYDFALFWGHLEAPRFDATGRWPHPGADLRGFRSANASMSAPHGDELLKGQLAPGLLFYAACGLANAYLVVAGGQAYFVDANSLAYDAPFDARHVGGPDSQAETIDCACNAGHCVIASGYLRSPAGVYFVRVDAVERAPLDTEPMTIPDVLAPVQVAPAGDRFVAVYVEQGALHARSVGASERLLGDPFSLEIAASTGTIHFRLARLGTRQVIVYWVTGQAMYLRTFEMDGTLGEIETVASAGATSAALVPLSDSALGLFYVRTNEASVPAVYARVLGHWVPPEVIESDAGSPGPDDAGSGVDGGTVAPPADGGREPIDASSPSADAGPGQGDADDEGPRGSGSSGSCSLYAAPAAPDATVYVVLVAVVVIAARRAGGTRRSPSRRVIP